MDLFGSPANPRFARVEDEFDMAVVVHNNTKENKSVQVALEVNGLKLLSGEVSQNVNVRAGSQEKLEFKVQAEDEGTAEFLFKLANNGVPVDAVKKQIPILPYGLEIVDSVSNVVNYEMVEEMYVDPSVNKNYGGLNAELYGTFIGVADDSVNQLTAKTNNQMTENVSSRMMALVYKYKYQLKQFDQEDTYSKSVVESDIRNLVNLQLMDGGWGYWKDSDGSDVYNTTIALEALLEAERAGFAVDLDVVNQGVNYVQNAINSQTSIRTDELSYILYVLEMSGSDQTGRLQSMYSMRHSLSDYSKAYLILAMWENKSKWGKFQSQLLAELGEKADLGSQRVFWNSPDGYWFVQHDVAVTSAVLRAINKLDPKSPLASLAVGHITQKTPNSYYTNFVRRLMSVSLYENVLEKGIKSRDTKVELLVNDNVVAEGEVKKEDVNSKFEHFIPVSELAEGSNKLQFKLVKGGDSYYNFVLKTLMPFENVEPKSNEIALEREFLDFDGNVLDGKQFKVGETYIVRLTLASPNLRRNLLLEDFLPGGMESVNGTLKNESSLNDVRMAQVSEQTSDANHLWISNLQMEDSKTEMYINYINKGLYEYTYVVRATVPGTYKLRPAQVYERYSPDIRANTSGGLIEVVE
ncbi:hypothetical protein JXA34_00200 [Patescibacteria group bacterium]|nr:hypothetical protein [Patescibacteria group bacterium]